MVRYTGIAGAAARIKNEYAGVAELAALFWSAAGGSRSDKTKAQQHENCERNRARRVSVASRIAGAAARIKNEYAGVAELADAQDLGSCVHSCRFKSCHPHHEETIILIRKISVLWLFYCLNRGIFPFFIGFIAKMLACLDVFPPCKLF